MRKINFKEPNSDEWKSWRKKCIKKTKEHILAVRRGGKPQIDDRLYKEQKAFYFKRAEPFWGKCVYCEKHITILEDLDHFRPKNKVTDENDVIISIVNKSGKKVNHPGYYWLAYECMNLLPSCKECNSASRQKGVPIGKRSRFPISGKRATKPGEEKYEKPLLINPIQERPEAHFNWDHNKSIIYGKTRKGKICIKVFGFCEREGLGIKWAEIYMNTVLRYSNLLNKCVEQGPIVWKQKKKEFMEEITKGKVEYSFVALVVIKHYKL